MKKNMGVFDKGLRFVIAVIIGVLYFANIISGTVALTALVIGVVLIVTSLIGTCPLYLPFGISTEKKTKA